MRILAHRFKVRVNAVTQFIQTSSKSPNDVLSRTLIQPPRGGCFFGAGCYSADGPNLRLRRQKSRSSGLKGGFLACEVPSLRYRDDMSYRSARTNPSARANPASPQVPPQRARSPSGRAGADGYGHPRVGQASRSCAAQGPNAREAARDCAGASSRLPPISPRPGRHPQAREPDREPRSGRRRGDLGRQVWGAWRLSPICPRHAQVRSAPGAFLGRSVRGCRRRVWVVPADAKPKGNHTEKPTAVAHPGACSRRATSRPIAVGCAAVALARRSHSICLGGGGRP